MDLPLPFWTQYECRHESLEVYASDRRGEILYQFNNLGYRNDIDYVCSEQAVGVFIGSSITSGIGVDWHKSYAYLTSQKLKTKTYHFSQGCMEIDNNETLRVLRAVKASNLIPDYFVLQFINLDRVYDPSTGITTYCQDRESNIKRFLKVLLEIENLLANDRWCFFGCDAKQHALPDHVTKHNHCVSWNSPFIDRAGVGEHPGVKWHNMISMALAKYLKQPV